MLIDSEHPCILTKHMVVMQSAQFGQTFGPASKQGQVNMGMT